MNGSAVSYHLSRCPQYISAGRRGVFKRANLSSRPVSTSSTQPSNLPSPGFAYPRRRLAYFRDRSGGVDGVYDGNGAGELGRGRGGRGAFSGVVNRRTAGGIGFHRNTSCRIRHPACFRIGPSVSRDTACLIALRNGPWRMICSAQTGLREGATTLSPFNFLTFACLMIASHIPFTQSERCLKPRSAELERAKVIVTGTEWASE